MKDKIEKLRNLKTSENQAGAIGTGHIYAVLNEVIDATIELLEREQPKQEPQKDKWKPLKKGWGYPTDNSAPYYSTMWLDGFVDSSMICKTEEDAIEKHKLLRAVSRLNSVIREYGEYVPIVGQHNCRPCFDHSGKWIVISDVNPSPLYTYHIDKVINDVCTRLNSGEIEL